MNDGFDYRLEQTTWQKRFAILPKRSVKSNKLIWFKFAFRCEKLLTGPGDAIVETSWVTVDEFILMCLGHTYRCETAK